MMRSKSKPKGRQPVSDSKKTPRLCGVDGCPRAEYRRSGVCKPHADQDISVEYLCSAEGCEKKSRANGLCIAHYQNERRHKNGENSKRNEWPARRTHPLAFRVSDECLAMLRSKGKQNAVASDLLEELAAKHSSSQAA